MNCARRSSLTFVTAFIVVGCGGTSGETPPPSVEHDAAVNDGGATDSVAAPHDAAPSPSDSDASSDVSHARLGNCGDVPPATNHPAFEAIKRLATTKEEVRILVYGQSIALQDWWMQVRDWLKKTYPAGNLVMESHGRGACSSECLAGAESWFTDGKTENRLPADVYAWRPDLVLFNVYGGEGDYTYVAKGLVDGCSAFDTHPVATAHCRPDQVFPGYRRPEVLLQTDHRLPGTYPDVDVNLKNHNEVFIPDLAKGLGVSWGDVWTKWGAWLDAHERDASVYLADGLHLNDRGNVLMSSLVEQDLCYRPEP